MSALLRISSPGVKRTLTELRRAGGGVNESCAFWLGGAVSANTELIVVPEGPGVALLPLSITISERWMDQLGELTDNLDLVVLGAVHTHPNTAFFSGIDLDGFFHATDCVSVVVPHYGMSNLEEADTAWATLVGLPWNEWRPSRWSAEVEVHDGLDPRVRLVRLNG